MRVEPGAGMVMAGLVLFGTALVASRSGAPDTAPREAGTAPPRSASRSVGRDSLTAAAPLEAAALGPAARRPALPRLGPDHPIVVEGQLVELLAIGAAEPNRPAGGRRLTLEPRTGEGPVIETVTGADGRFHFELAPREERPFWYTLRVAGDERRRAIEHTRKIEKGHSEHRSVLLRRALRGAPRGVVVDGEGNPLGGVRLHCGWPRGAMASSFSGPDGTFELTGSDEYGLLEVEAEGYRLLRSRDSRRRPLGGWSTGVITLGAITPLTLRAIDAEGVPVEGARVRVTPLHEEPTFDRRPDPESVGSTDRDGYVTLDEVWCGPPLAVEVTTEEFEDSAGRHLDGVLQFSPEAPGKAIVLHPGEPMELEARLVGGLRIDGRIANLGERDVEVELHSATISERLEPVEVDAEGCFELHVPHRLRGGALVVTAREVRVSSDRDSLPAIAREVVEEGQARGGRLELLLNLCRSASIRGVLTGSPSSVVELWAVPAGSPDPLAARREGEMEGTWNGRPFVIGGLMPGRYDLVLCLGRGVWGGGVRVVRDVPTGTVGLEIPFPDSEEVIVNLVPEDPSIELRRILVRTVRLRRETPRAGSAGRLHLGDPHGWTEAIGWETGDRGSLEGGGSWRSRSFSVLSRQRVRLAPTQAGEYLIGVQAESKQGTVYALVSAPAMQLTPGEHTFHFALIAAGSVEVDCSRIVTGEHWLRLRHARHGDVPVDSEYGVRELPVRGRETVLLDGLPPGTEYELLVGSRGDLSEGKARWRIPLAIRAGERTTVEVAPSDGYARLVPARATDG